MSTRSASVVLTTMLLAGLVPSDSSGQSASAESADKASAYFVEHSANVFRRFNGDGVKTLEFYGEVLGFRDIGTANVGRGQGVSRYQVGPSQLKFTKAGANAKFTRGAINDAAGVRLWTMWFPDESALTRRFADHGFMAPVFKDIEGMRSALLTDPDGEWIRLIVVPNAPAETYGQLEIGIAANDLEKSRTFYRTFVGLEELPAVKDPVLGVSKYPFRHGSTTISVWQTPGPKPTNPQLAGIQYVVKPVDPIWALAQQRAIPVEQPLAETLPGLVTTWLYDPDQVTNYFAEIRPRGSRQPAAGR